ncbi:MAG: hypothetical protein HC905_05705 [Bacteroidales bacterium]|nr:hypothetical protein [Bacteroidales bacterium]
MEKIIKPTALVFILIAISQMCICQEIKQKSSNETTFDNDREVKEKKTASFINQKSEDVKVNEAMIKAYQNSTSETDEISFMEFMRDNPEDFSVKYQAYMRTRLAENTDSMQQILYTEMVK